jgi:hypothetical protein
VMNVLFGNIPEGHLREDILASFGEAAILSNAVFTRL